MTTEPTVSETNGQHVPAAPASEPHNRLSQETAAAPDPFDANRLRLSQDFAASVGVKKALLTVPVRKPAKEWFVQVHPDESYRIQTAVVELKEDR